MSLSRRPVIYLLVMGVLAGFPHPAHAQFFAEPTLVNMLRGLMRFQAIDIQQDRIIDFYAKTADCDLFKKKFDNEFEWEKVRQATREGIRQSVGGFPTAFRYETTMQLDRYDFSRGLYPFFSKDRETRFDVNSFTVSAKDEPSCGRDSSRAPIPLEFKFVTGKTVKMDGLSLSEEQGKELIKRMEAVGNNDRLIYPRFNFRVRFIATLVPKTVLNEAEKTKSWQEEMRHKLSVSQDADGTAVTINCDLDSIEYYEDKERTRLIYVYWP